MANYLLEIGNFFQTLSVEEMYLFVWFLYGIQWITLIKTLKGRLTTILWYFLATFMAGCLIYCAVTFSLFSTFPEWIQISYFIGVAAIGMGIPIHLLDSEFSRAGYPKSYRYTREAFCVLIPGFPLALSMYIWIENSIRKIFPSHLDFLPISNLYHLPLPITLNVRKRSILPNLFYLIVGIVMGVFAIKSDALIFGYSFIGLCILAFTAIFSRLFFLPKVVINTDGIILPNRSRLLIKWDEIHAFRVISAHGDFTILIDRKEKDTFWSKKGLQNYFGYDPRELCDFLNTKLELHNNPAVDPAINLQIQETRP